MFFVIDKHQKRVVKQELVRQDAIDYALKYSSIGGNQYIIAEVVGETKQITTSVFSETKEASLGPITDEVKYVGGKPISELRQGVHNVESSNSGGVVLAAGAFDRHERIPILSSNRVDSGQQGNYGDVEGHAESTPDPRG